MKHIVGFSGGIDSQACALWVRQRFAPEDSRCLPSRKLTPLTERAAASMDCVSETNAPAFHGGDD